MYDINLIPERKYNTNTVTKTTLISIAAVAVSAILIYFGIIDPLRQQYYVEQMYRMHKSQMAKFETIAVEHSAISANLDQLRLRKDGLNVLFEDIIPSSFMVASIDEEIPQRVYIFNNNYGGGNFALQGRAPSLLEVADFSIRLKDTGLFESVRVLSVERDLAARDNSFVINLKMLEE